MLPPRQRDGARNPVWNPGRSRHCDRGVVSEVPLPDGREGGGRQRSGSQETRAIAITARGTRNPREVPMEGLAAASTRVLGTERGRIIVLAAFIIALYVVAIGLLVVYGPAHWALLSTATLAYTLGLRHAFDADHIAAIDNTTRQLRHRGHRSVGVGFFFSLGHSSVVVALTLVAALVS